MTNTAATDTSPAARTARAESGAEASPTRTRRSRTNSDEESSGNTRYFLAEANVNNGSLALGREVVSEGEALVEALRLGVTYYEIQQYRVVPDFSGRKPLLGKEAVNTK